VSEAIATPRRTARSPAVADGVEHCSELRRAPGDAGDLAVYAVEGGGELHEHPAGDQQRRLLASEGEQGAGDH